MRRHRQRKPTLLGEAFAMKESDGWAAAADNIHVRQDVESQRRKLLLLIALTLVILTSLIVVLVYLF